jgi:hypothetical protein
MDIYRYPLYPWVSVYPKKVSMYKMDFHRFPTEGGGGPLYNPSLRTREAPRVQAAHIPRISRAYLPRQNRVQAPDCSPPPQLIGGLTLHGFQWISMELIDAWISMDIEVDA